MSFILHRIAGVCISYVTQIDAEYLSTAASNDRLNGLLQLILLSQQPVSLTSISLAVMGHSKLALLLTVGSIVIPRIYTSSQKIYLLKTGKADLELQIQVIINSNILCGTTGNATFFCNRKSPCVLLATRRDD